MPCFWRCGAFKNDIIESPQQEFIEDNLTEIDVEIVDTPVEDCEPSASACLEPTIDNETVCENVTDKLCSWYGTISNAYNNEREYYVLNDDPDAIIYFGRFPFEWATNHESGTGPGECESCVTNGIYHDVFLGYCVGCAIEKYKGLRGRGFISPGTENHYDTIMPSAFDTYLKDVDLDLIGKDYIWYGLNVEMEYAVDYTDDDLVI